MSSNGKGFFKGVIVGGILGAVTALLYAPKNGEEMREDLKIKLDSASKDLAHKMQEAKKSGSTESKELLEKAEKLKKDLDRRSLDLSKSTSKISKVASDEAKLLAHQAVELAIDLGASTKKVVKQGQKEVARMSRNSQRSKARETKAATPTTKASGATASSPKTKK